MANTLKKNAKLKKSQDRQYQLKICTWIALYKTTTQVLSLLKKRMDITMTASNIDTNYRYAKKWKPVIAYIRKRYLNNVARIPIASKGYRLSLLQEAAEEALTWHTKTKNQYGIVKEKKIGNVAQIVSEARREIEGEKPLIDNSTKVEQNYVTIYRPEPYSRKKVEASCRATDRSL